MGTLRQTGFMPACSEFDLVWREGKTAAEPISLQASEAANWHFHSCGIAVISSRTKSDPGACGHWCGRLRTDPYSASAGAALGNFIAQPKAWRYVQESTMAVPKKKVSRMKRGNRRSADALTSPVYTTDKGSGELRRPHHIDLKSGKYRGRQILAPKADI